MEENKGKQTGKRRGRRNELGSRCKKGRREAEKRGEIQRKRREKGS